MNNNSGLTEDIKPLLLFIKRDYGDEVANECEKEFTKKPNLNTDQIIEIIEKIIQKVNADEIRAISQFRFVKTNSP